MPQLCLNAIVRNEAARIERMLDSVKPYISTFALFDTGSTDGTVELVQQWAERNAIKGVVAVGTFIDFSQARNQALSLARSWHKHPDAPDFDFLVLCDADMEMRVDDASALTKLSGEAYMAYQKAGGSSYQNVRFLNAKSESNYIGVTHEYLGCDIAGVLDSVWFTDHADGSNRAEKYSRDIRLLRADLERDPLNPRSWFYLANTYRDSGDYTQAIAAYRKRIELGDWDEERWTARCYLADCLQMQGVEDAFIKEALCAYNARPIRAEPLHTLAKHFRLKGDNASAALFAEAGLALSYPKGERLFVQDWVYDWGLKEELSIAGYSVERTRKQAFRATNELALSRTAPDYVRQNARTNMVWYLKPLREFCPSACCTEIDFVPQPGFTPMNPSITNRPDGSLEVLVRTVNYKINDAGQYMIGDQGCWDAPIVTENWLLQIDNDFATHGGVPVTWDRSAPKFDKVIGLEDMRLYWINGFRTFSACVREQSLRGQCEQWVGELQDSGEVLAALPVSDGETTEKNWIRWPERLGLYSVYRLDKLITDYINIEKVERPIAVDNISGSSQWVDFCGGKLSVVHEAVVHPGHGKRVYQHRFAWLSNDFSTLNVSLPFVFKDVQIEFCAGLARHPTGDLVISFGVRDAEAWLCRVAQGEVQCMLGS